MQVIKNRFVKILFWLFAGVLVLFILVASVIQLPYIQTRIVHYISGILSEKSQFTITVSQVSIDWFDQINLGGVKIIDPENNTMADIQEVVINYAISSLLSSEAIAVDRVSVYSPVIYLTYLEHADTATAINVSHFINNIRSISPGEEKRNVFSIEELTVNDGAFAYNNQFRDSLVNRFDYHHFKIARIEGQVKNFELKGDTVSFGLTHFKGSQPQTGLSIHQVQCRLQLTKTELAFENLDARVGDSHIKDKICISVFIISRFCRF